MFLSSNVSVDGLEAWNVINAEKDGEYDVSTPKNKRFHDKSLEMFTIAYIIYVKKVLLASKSNWLMIEMRE